MTRESPTSSEDRSTTSCGSMSLPNTDTQTRYLIWLCSACGLAIPHAGLSQPPLDQLPSSAVCSCSPESGSREGEVLITSRTLAQLISATLSTDTKAPDL